MQGESNSISNQKQMLEEYARRNRLPNPTHFTDDGISGTRFDRPGFLAMMEEVEAGRVEAIAIKDMSRLGRDYLKEYRPGLYCSLILSEKLYPHLLEIDRLAQERMDTMLPCMMEVAGVTEDLKARDPMSKGTTFHTT